MEILVEAANLSTPPLSLKYTPTVYSSKKEEKKEKKRRYICTPFYSITYD